MDKVFEGPLSWKRYFKGALPSVLSMVFLSFYTTIDGLFVSHAAGPDALAAVNIVIPLTCLFFGLAVMLATGGGAIIGEEMGEGRMDEASRDFSTLSLVLSAVLVVFTVLGLAFLRPLARILGASGRLESHVIAYMIPILIGAIPMGFKLYFEYLLRTDGFPGHAMLMSGAGLVLNVIFDALFVLVLDWGTFGAGLGTLLSILISALMGLGHFIKGRRLSFKRPRYKKGLLLKSCTNGSSEMMSELSTGVTTLAFNWVLMTLYGEDGVAAITVVMYVYYFFIAFYMGLGVAAAPQVSFSLGARDWGRMSSMLRYSLVTVLVSQVVLCGLSAGLSSPIAAVFLEPGAARDLTVVALKVTSLVFLTCGLNVFASAWFTALGDGLSSALISTLRSMALPLPLIVAMPFIIAPSAAWWALPLADALTLVVTGILYKKKGTVGYVRSRKESQPFEGEAGRAIVYMDDADLGEAFP